MRSTQRWHVRNRIEVYGCRKDKGREEGQRKSDRKRRSEEGCNDVKDREERQERRRGVGRREEEGDEERVEEGTQPQCKKTSAKSGFTASNTTRHTAYPCC